MALPEPRWFSPKSALVIWLPVLAISALHYISPPDAVWVHDVLRRLYYLPIIVAAFRHGRNVALTAALFVTLTYLPHAFLHDSGIHARHAFHQDPGGTVHKALEILLYHVVALVSGELADRERRRRRELENALDERRRLERQLIRAGRLGALGELVAGIAHELRNPLHVLRGTAEVVAPLIPKDCPETRMWELHVSELDRLERVSERFLSFASPAKVVFEPLDLRQVADRLVSLVSVEAKKRGISIELHCEDEDADVLGDRDQLAQVGLNIAVNAMQAIGNSSGKIRVSVRRVPLERHAETGDEACVLRIENDGPRIAEQDREHLFDPFHSGRDGGSGLGLSIASRIVEQHHGAIEVDGEGLGVGFSIVLPALSRSCAQQT